MLRRGREQKTTVKKELSLPLPIWCRRKNSFASHNKKKKNMQENNNAKPKQTAQFKKNNKKGGGCFVCGSDEHWASAFPDHKYKQEKKSSNVVISETGGGTSGYGNSLPFVLSVYLSPE